MEVERLLRIRAGHAIIIIQNFDPISLASFPLTRLLFCYEFLRYDRRLVDSSTVRYFMRKDGGGVCGRTIESLFLVSRSCSCSQTKYHYSND